MTRTRNRRNYHQRKEQAAQTLVIAVIILAVLLILGIGFAALLSQNIQSAGTSAKRTRSDDLADAGIRYVHDQFLYSNLGADWRPDGTVLDGTANLTKDRDALYLRPASNIMVAPDPTRPTFQIPDRGGPDFMGAFSRVNFQRGSVLIRVRYGPSSYAANVPGKDDTDFTSPGRTRAALTIEAVGRPDVTSTDRSDPTLQSDESVKYQGYADEADLRTSVSAMKSLENRIVDSRKLMAVVNLGLTDNARSFWNKFHETRPIQIGFPANGPAGPLWLNSTSTGIDYEGQNVQPAGQIGEDAAGAATVAGNSTGWSNVPGLGGILANGDLEVHGKLNVDLNRPLGDQILVAGRIYGANDSAQLKVNGWNYKATVDQWSRDIVSTLTGPTLDSNSGSFDTNRGLIRDGAEQNDANNYVRGFSRREPPSLIARSPQTGVNRYEALSRFSGSLNSAGQNVGEWGYGQGIFIDSNERGNRANADERVRQDPSKSLTNDWLNPNNANSKGWVGPYYIPVATYMELLPDGFKLIRDSRSKNPFWRDPSSGSTPGNKTSQRYWLRKYNGATAAYQNKTYIVDEMQAPGFDPAISDDAFVASPGAREFSGIVLAAGDLRVRGVIPTDIQMSVIAQGTLYIEGSVTKGVVTRRSDNGAPEVLNRPSRSMALLGARDYVALNTTQFFAPAPGQSPQAKLTENVADVPSPMELDATKNQVSLQAQFLLDPKTVSGPTRDNPQTWLPYVSNYKTSALGGSAVPISSHMLLTTSADDDGPAFASMKVTPLSFGQAGPGDYSYLFPARYNFMQGATLYSSEATNDAGPFFTSPGPFPAPWTIPLLGLGHNGLNTYPRFQTVASPIYDNVATYWQSYLPADRLVKPALNPDTTSKNPNGLYQLAMQDETQMDVRLDSVVGQPAKNMLIARTAVAPYDVRIEATIYAEEGSFFVIPGQWFNTNSSDTRARFESKLTSFGGSSAALDYGNSTPLAQAQVDRYTTFGNSPEVPFYGEPLDIRVTIIGALSENMPAPMSQQTEWLKKWGYLPRKLGATGLTIPDQHNNDEDLTIEKVAPNLVVSYDPELATAYALNDPSTPLRYNDKGDVLPPLPRLPVSPTLAYFGESNP